MDNLLFGQARPFFAAVQSLFIFGSKREALETILKGWHKRREKEEGIELALDTNTAAIGNHLVLLPLYRKLDGRLLVEQHEPRKFEIHTERKRPTQSNMWNISVMTAYCLPVTA